MLRDSLLCLTITGFRVLVLSFHCQLVLVPRVCYQKGAGMLTCCRKHVHGVWVLKQGNVKKGAAFTSVSRLGLRKSVTLTARKSPNGASVLPLFVVAQLYITADFLFSHQSVCYKSMHFIVAQSVKVHYNYLISGTEQCSTRFLNVSLSGNCCVCELIATNNHRRVILLSSFMTGSSLELEDYRYMVRGQH